MRSSSKKDDGEPSGDDTRKQNIIIRVIINAAMVEYRGVFGLMPADLLSQRPHSARARPLSINDHANCGIQLEYAAVARNGIRAFHTDRKEREWMSLWLSIEMTPRR